MFFSLRQLCGGVIGIGEYFFFIAQLGGGVIGIGDSGLCLIGILSFEETKKVDEAEKKKNRI
jgi:hypothetical protein